MHTDKTKLLDRAALAGDDRILLARILDLYQRSQSRSVPAHTGFLSPAEQTAAKSVLRLAGAHERRFVFSGGFDGAERQVLHFLPEWAEEPEPVIRLLGCEWPMGPELNHRDLLGSLMAMGISRERLGDILVTETAAQVLVLGETADWLLENWRGAGRARFTPRELALHTLQAPTQRVKEVRDTVATLRLDAVLASGFAISRGRAAELIAGGKVQVNHRDCLKGDRLVAQADVLTVRGLGKCELEQVGGLSKKGRTTVLLKRYL